MEGVLYYRILEVRGGPPGRPGLAQAKRVNDAIEASPRAGNPFVQVDAKRQEDRAAVWDEFLSASSFRAEGMSVIGGEPGIAIAFQSRPSYQPKAGGCADLFQKARGRIWVNKSSRGIVRMELLVTADAEFCPGLQERLHRGFYTVELAKQIDGLWLPVRDERVEIWKTIHTNSVLELTADHQYRKFSVFSDFKSGAPVK